MKKKIVLPALLTVFVGSLLISCTKKTSGDSAIVPVTQAPVTLPLTETPTETTFTNFADNDWKGVIWTPFKGDWTSNGASKDGADLVAAGIKWDRFWFQANYTSDKLDAIVNQHLTKGIKMVACYVKSFPTANLGTSAEQTTEINMLKSWVARYKTNIRYWEIGNEINSTTYWTLGAGQGSADSTTPYNVGVANYVKWLKLANTAIKSVDPTATVILGGLSEYYMEPFVDQLTIDSAYKYCDEAAFHPYAENDNPVPDHSVARLLAFKNKMAAWPTPKNNMPIWITEVGFHVGSISSPGMVADEATKAAYLQQTYSKFIQTLPWKRPIFWYNLQESNPAADYYNLISRATDTATATYYPAYFTYQAMNTSWDYWAAGIVGTTSLYEAENLTVASSSGKGISTYSETAASNGKGSKYASDVVGDSIAYLLPPVVPGTYTVYVNVKKINTRGIYQMEWQPVGGAIQNLGSPQDQYNSVALYSEINVGNITVTTTNNLRFIFKVTGKNTLSTGYDGAFDYFKLVRQ